jgi:sensor histidine kinase YesM
VSHARFWIERAGYGFLFGAAIATLEFAYYLPLISGPHPMSLQSFASLLLMWCGEAVILAIVFALVERSLNSRDLRAWELALAVTAGVAIGVLIWQTLIQVVLRERLGMRVFIDHVGQPVVWTGLVLYHSWLMLFFGSLAAAVYASQRRRARMLAALRSAQLDRAGAEQRLAQARLASLQARVEPDFLLQRLTRLERSYETDPDAADRLLDELIAFLRGALADIRAHKPDAKPPLENV